MFFNAVDIKVLNKATGAYQSDSIDQAILYCLLNAPNAFELLLISFDLITKQNSSQALKKRIFKLHRFIIDKIHNLVYSQANETIINETYLLLLKTNIKKLIAHPSIQENLNSKKVQFRMIYLICIYFGREFVTEVFHHLLNSSRAHIDIGNYESPRINYLLSPLFSSLELYFGRNIQDSLRGTLKLFFTNKTITFWASLYAWFDTKAEDVQLDLPDLIEYLNQKPYIAQKEIIFAKYYILKILIRMFATSPRHFQREQFKLSAALLELYFDLIDRIHRADRAHLSIYLSTLIECQNFLAKLAQANPLNEQIIVKNLLDLIQVRNVLFLERHTNAKINTINYCTSLLNENSLRSDKIKKSKLLPFYKEQRDTVPVENMSAFFNRQLIIDLFLKCIRDKISFAKTFIGSLSNEVLLNEVTWTEEDNRDGQNQHIRVRVWPFVVFISFQLIYC